MIAFQSDERASTEYIGSGPYRLVDLWEDEDGEYQFTLEAFPDYRGAPEYSDDFFNWREPVVRNVEYLAIDDEEVRHEMLMAGEVHMLVGYDPDWFFTYEAEGFTLCGTPTHYIAVRPDVEGFVCLPNLTVRLDYIQWPDFIRFAVPAYQ